MPESEVGYPGSSVDRAFVATEPFILNIVGEPVQIGLSGSPRIHDFGGAIPFIDAQTGASAPWMMQAWAPQFAATFNPPLVGTHDLEFWRITNAGMPGRIEKHVYNGEAVTMVRYNAGDGITEGKCRSQLISWPVPPRTRVRWELKFAFGAADGANEWTLTPPAHWQAGAAGWEPGPGASPVLFWQLRSPFLSKSPALAADVDTDANDLNKLAISFTRLDPQTGRPVEIGRVGNLPRHEMIGMTIDAFLDERNPADGGKGVVQVRVNDQLVVENVGPTLSYGKGVHYWQLDSYLWNEPSPYRYTRAVFWKVARMLVFPPVAP